MAHNTLAEDGCEMSRGHRGICTVDTGGGAEGPCPTLACSPCTRLARRGELRKLAHEAKEMQRSAAQAQQLQEQLARQQLERV